jgi:hypothetical protein
MIARQGMVEWSSTKGLKKKKKSDSKAGQSTVGQNYHRNVDNYPIL